MPMEGHWERVNTPLRRITKRERNVAIGGVLVSALAILAVILATSGNAAPKADAGCIYAIIPGVMGAEPVDACGREAELSCARHQTGNRPGSETIREACRKAGIKISPEVAAEAASPNYRPQRSTSTGI